MHESRAEVVFPCAALPPALEFWQRLGFQPRAIFPADAPRSALLEGHGLRLWLERGAGGGPGRLRLACAAPEALAGGARELVSPDGTRVELVELDPPLRLPPAAPAFSLARAREARWGVGRAGMRYRDLIPERQGGRWIASHIAIPEAGPVPDQVHFHEVRFQVIHCWRGWVRLVYEDQGPPFVLQAGDCVLQPPGIRHRVLECSAGLEVIEVASPAEHLTRFDPALELPTVRSDPARDFQGQRFVRHEARLARWEPWRAPGFEQRDTGVGRATGGLAGVRVVRRVEADAAPEQAHAGELQLWCVLAGGAELVCAGRAPEPLEAGDAVGIPPGLAHALRACTRDLELLEVTLPA